MNTARFVKKLEKWRSDARLFKLDPPLGRHDYVIVSAAVVHEDPRPPGVPFDDIFLNCYEVAIFPSNEEGEAMSMCALMGSYRGGLSHEQAIMNAGYLVIPDVVN